MTYDAVGNLTQDGVNTYTYDAENNLTKISGASSATYAYNGFNQRMQATANGVTDRYGLDLAGRRSTTWLDGATTLKLAQYYGDSGPLAFWAASDGHIHFEHQDYLGTERIRTDRVGNVESAFGSLPFGEQVSSSGTDIAPGHFALLDQDLAASAGLSHAMFREYSSTQGRWTSPDPSSGSYDAGSPQSYNRYSYAMNSPLAFTDLAGLTPCPPGSYDNCVDTNGSTSAGEQVASGCWYCGTTSVGGDLPWWILEYGGPYCPNGGGGTAFNGSLCAGSNAPAAAAAPPAPKPPTKAVRVARCASNLANSISADSLVSPEAPTFVHNFLSNDISSISDFLTGPARVGAAVSLVQGKALNTVVRGVGLVPVGADKVILGQNGAGTYFAKDIIPGTLANAAVGRAAGKVLGIASTVKLLYDIASYAESAYTCRSE